MTSSSEIIIKIKDAINQNEDLSSDSEAVRAYEQTNLPVPLKKSYFSLSCAENSVEKTDTGNSNSLVIRMTCFTPLTQPPYATNDLAEKILQYMNSIFGDDLVSYSVGETKYDDYVKAYKVICLLSFLY